MRYRRLDVLWILLLLLCVAATGAPAQSQGAVDDTYLKELEVRDALLEKGGEAALGIRVTVDGTKAILTGEVPTRAAQELAEQVALSVEGIKSVNNRLKIKAGTEQLAGDKLLMEMADAKLESKVKHRLHDEIGKKAKQLEVEATDGVVSLRGTLPDASRKELALATAGKTEGVKRVIDLIKVKP